MTLFPPDDLTLTVTQLHASINAALKAELPAEVWVRGEMHRVSSSRRGHTYFELVERKRVGTVQATLDVALLEWNRAPVDQALESAGGVTLAEGIEVRIRGKVGVYAPSGRLQFEMTGIDPDFTVGRLAADRDRLLRVLSEEGLLGANASLGFPRVPLRIGLVTSVGSAAYHDFIQELHAAPFGWRIDTYDVRVQGRDAPGSIVRALRHAEGRRLDAIVLIRGGGARSELVVFDAEPIARTIATLTTPVLTGIGHETDRSVADDVAHRAFKTPTAVAQALGAKVAAFVEYLADAERRVLDVAPATLADAAARVEGAARHVRAGARRHLALAERNLGGRQDLIFRSAAAAPTRAAARTDRGVEVLVRRPPEILARAAALVDARSDQVRALDPKRVLARGYSITRTADGRVLRTASAVRASDELTTELAEGSVVSRVEGDVSRD